MPSSGKWSEPTEIIEYIIVLRSHQKEAFVHRFVHNEPAKNFLAKSYTWKVVCLLLYLSMHLPTSFYIQTCFPRTNAY